MSKKTPDVRGLLLEGHFGMSRTLPPSDPIAPTPILLDIDQIIPYDRNPRREANERYEDIKASIKARGLDAPLRITRRPGDSHYMIAAGGNSRLSALQALWKDTAEPRFLRVQCLFTPWVSESDVLGGHLIENELRADLVLIDKALALRDLKAILEAETGSPFSRSAFQRQLASLGYRLSRRQLIRYDYVVDQLNRVIPSALRAGMGVRQVDQVREIENAFRSVYRSLCANRSLPPFDPLWDEVLSKHDTGGLDLLAVRRDVEDKLATHAGIPPNTFRQTVDAVLHAQPQYDEEAYSDVQPQPSESDVPVFQAPTAHCSSAEAGHTDAPPISAIRRRGPRVSSREASGFSEQTRSAADGQTPVAGSFDLSQSEKGLPPEPTPAFLSDGLNRAFDGQRDTLPRRDDLKSWRARCAVLAARFAQHLGLASQVIAAKEGLGFFIDLPSGPPSHEVGWASWWMLFALCEQGLTKPRMGLIPKHLTMSRVLTMQPPTDLFDRAGKPPAATMLGFQLLSSPQLSDAAFRDLLLLIESCRALKTQFRESDLWACPTVQQYLQSPF